MLLPILALLAALWAGLVRLGWQLPPLRPTLPSAHGPLMVSGFLGTLITLERAVALNMLFKSRWPYLAALVSGLGGIALLVGALGVIGPPLITLGSAGLLVLLYFIVSHHPAIFTGIMALGAVAWLVGNGLWLWGRPLYEVVWWWAGFLILTIAGERLELGRLTRLGKKQQGVFTAVAILLILGLVALIFNYDVGVRLAGLGILGVALWLLRYDVARRTSRQTGLPRFIGIAMLSGYVWLAIGGVLAIILGGVQSGLYYDAILHAIFLGFTFAMIFGRAPIIFPSVLGLELGYRPFFYAHLILLHLSLILRLIGDLALWLPGRAWGGLINVLVLLLFLGNTISAMGKQEADRN